MTSSFTSALPPASAPHQAWKAGLPSEYMAVEQYVTQGGSTPPATDLLCPLLLTSGLPRSTLAHLWELANRGSPGQLTISELHCLLAMVALAQRGQPLKLLEDGRYPVPRLNLVQFSISVPGPAKSLPPPSSDFADFKSAVEEEADEFCDFQQALPLGSAASVSKFDPAFNTPHYNSFYSGRPAASQFPSSVSPVTSTSSSLLSTPVKALAQSMSNVIQPNGASSSEELIRPQVHSKPTEDIFSWPPPLSDPQAPKHLSNPEPSLSPQTQAPLIDPNFKCSEQPSSSTTPLDEIIRSSISVENLGAPKGETIQKTHASFLQPVSANEDKYSCFRRLAIVSNASSWSIAEEKEEPKKVEEDDDFGDFVAASVPTFDLSPLGKGNLFQPQVTPQDFLLRPPREKPQDTAQQECQSVSSLELDLPVMPPDEEASPQEVPKEPLTLDSKLAYTLEGLNFGSPVLSDPSSTLTLGLFLPEPAASNGILGKVSADRYSCIRQEVERQDNDEAGLHIYEWTRCLRCCKRLIEEANDVLGLISNPEVCREVLTSEQGSRYLIDLVEVYRVAERIAKAASGRSSPEMQQLSRAIRKAWQQFGSLVQEPGIKACHPEEHGADSAALCGVCLLQVKDRLLWFGGRKYHAGCANLWVNCVEPILPSLS